jgi:predicted nucleic acid-binding protein
MERPEELVIDASVVIKWFSEEEDSDRALSLRDRHTTGRTSLIAPDLLVYEIANALRFKPGLDSQVVSRAIEDLLDLQIEVMVPSGEVIAMAIEMAYEHDITVYDSCYLSLGQALGTEVVTADRKFYEKAKTCGFLRGL